jgi:hypothetical protein
VSDAQLAAAEKPVVNQRPSGSKPICERDVTNLVPRDVGSESTHQ